MKHGSEPRIGKIGSAHRGGPRRLIAGLRITRHDAVLLDVVRPFLPEAGSESDLAYRLWRRGLELTLAEVASTSDTLPQGTSEQLIAGLVAPRLLLLMPLLRRTGTLALLAISDSAPTTAPSVIGGSFMLEAIDTGAADTIVGLGGHDFL